MLLPVHTNKNPTAAKANRSDTVAEVANIINEDDYKDQQLP